MATVYYAYNTTDLYLSNNDLSSDSTYGTAQGYSCGEYVGTNQYSSKNYNKSTCTKITILNEIQPNDCSDYFSNFFRVEEIIGIEKINFKNVDSLAVMFMYCGIEYLDLSKWDTTNINSVAGMFRYCSINEINISGWNLSNLEDASFMFEGCGNLTSLNLSCFDTINKSFSTNNMFEGCYNLTTIYVNNFDSLKIANSNYMFSSCQSLVGAVPYDSSKTDATMANYVTGYFTKIQPKPYITILKNKQDDTIYPRTLTSAVYDKDGKTLEDKLISYSPGTGISITNGVVSVNLPLGEIIKY